MTFADGEKKTKLKVIDKVGQRNTGTTVIFTPNAKYFESPTISIPRLLHVLRAKAVLCPGLLMIFEDKTVKSDKAQSAQWCFEDGLTDYLLQSTEGYERIPVEPFTGSMEGNE